MREGMTINERIELLINSLGYNPHSFTKTLGVKSTSTIANILRERDRKPSYDVLKKIIQRFPKVNAGWLLTGEGDMLLKKSDDIPLIGDRIKSIIEFYKMSEKEVAERSGVSVNELVNIITGVSENDDVVMALINTFPSIRPEWLLTNSGRMFKEFAYKDESSDTPDLRGIPLYRNTIIEGKQMLTKPEDTLFVSGFEDCEFSLFVHSKTMSPELEVGDIILCKTVSTDVLIHGQIYCIMTHNNIHLNRVLHSDKKGMIKLGYGNEDIEPFYLNKKDIETIVIVKGVIKRLW